MGEILPPHLSPFIDPERDQQYIPPEARALYDENELEAQHKLDEKIVDGQENSDEDEDGDANKNDTEGKEESGDEEMEEENENPGNVSFLIIRMERLY